VPPLLPPLHFCHSLIPSCSPPLLSAAGAEKDPKDTKDSTKKVIKIKKPKEAKNGVKATPESPPDSVQSSTPPSSSSSTAEGNGHGPVSSGGSGVNGGTVQAELLLPETAAALGMTPEDLAGRDRGDSLTERGRESGRESGPESDREELGDDAGQAPRPGQLPLHQHTFQSLKERYELLLADTKQTPDPTPIILEVESHITELTASEALESTLVVLTTTSSGSLPLQVAPEALLPIQADVIALFHEDLLPKVVTLLIGRSDISVSLKPRLNQVLHRILDLTVVAIKKYPLPVSSLELLLQLFGTPSRGFFSHSGGSREDMENQLRQYFYLENSDEDHQPQALTKDPKESKDSSPKDSKDKDAKEKPKKMPYAFLPPDDQNTSVYFIINIDYFGARGGFTSIIQRLRSLLPNIAEDGTVTMRAGEIGDLRTLKLFIAPFTKIQTYFTPDFLKSFVEEFHDLVLAHLLSLPEKEMKKEIGKGIPDIVKHMERLLSKVISEDGASERSTLFNLNLAMRSFGSATLERRLYGLSMMNKILLDIVSSVQYKNSEKRKREERSGLNMFMSFWRPSKEQEIPLLDTKFLVKWLRDNDFVRKLTSGNTHPELIKQGMDLLTLLAENDAIGKDELERLLAMAQGEHSFLKRTVFNAILEISPNLSAEATSHLIEGKLEALQDHEFDDPTLFFIFKLSLAYPKLLHLTPQLQKKGKLFGIQIFWRLVLSSSKSPLEIKELAGRYLLKLLHTSDFQNERIPLCVRCIDNLQNRESIPQSLDLICSIISTYPEKKAWKKDSKRSIIENLESQNQLLTKFFSTLSPKRK